MIKLIIILAAGFLLLIKGADWFVEGAAGLARRLGIPQLVIGLTIVAMGTSAPEAAVSISSALKGSAGIAVGNVLGSNILNILLILGITSIIAAVRVQRSTIRYEIPFLIIISLLFPVLGMAGGTISRMDGVILWVLFLVYLGYLWRMTRAAQAEPVTADHAELVREMNHGFGKTLVLGVIGIAMILIGADMTVDAAADIARTFGMSERMIGLTVVAFGTSLPELITSVMAGIKGEADIAIGNIVGSNIFNLLFVIGTAVLISPIPFTTSFIPDAVFAALAALVLLLLTGRKKQLTRSSGVVMLILLVCCYYYLFSV